MLGDMGYTDKLQKLCALRGLDQSALAQRVNLSKSSISRILSGTQEPKLRLAFNLAKALGVTLDYLVDDSPEVGTSDQLVMVNEDEMTVLKMVRRLGVEVAIDRLLNVPSQTPGATPRGEPNPPTSAPAQGSRSRTEIHSTDNG
jgi:transcriptional regulator with XRE-family HTH domain